MFLAKLDRVVPLRCTEVGGVWGSGTKRWNLHCGIRDSWVFKSDSDVKKFYYSKLIW
jgi:hypothetical protein